MVSHFDKHHKFPYNGVKFPYKHMTIHERAMERVHKLYIMQITLLDLLECDLANPTIRKQIRKTMREFEELLSEVDWRYMGGEDIVESLKSIPVEIDQKLKENTKRVMKKK